MTSKADFDLADRRAEEERETAISAASRALRAQGARYCEDCSAEIGSERRAALPSAKRCIRCQERHERRKKGR